MKKIMILTLIMISLLVMAGCKCSGLGGYLKEGMSPAQSADSCKDKSDVLHCLRNQGVDMLNPNICSEENMNYRETRAKCLQSIAEILEDPDFCNDDYFVHPRGTDVSADTCLKAAGDGKNKLCGKTFAPCCYAEKCNLASDVCTPNYRCLPLGTEVKGLALQSEKSCGSQGQSCCNGLCKSEDMVCYYDQCILKTDIYKQPTEDGCGLPKQKCCSNGGCKSDTLACINGVCTRCGFKGELCCDNKPFKCYAPFMCEYGKECN